MQVRIRWKKMKCKKGSPIKSFGRKLLDTVIQKHHFSITLSLITFLALVFCNFFDGFEISIEFCNFYILIVFLKKLTFLDHVSTSADFEVIRGRTGSKKLKTFFIKVFYN